MKSNKLLFFLLLISSWSFAQTFDVVGTVREAQTGTPIPGANVQVTNGAGTTTDLDGNFSLRNIPSGSQVTVSYIGYKNYEYTVTQSNLALVVTLAEDANVLEEVVVVGYGSQRRREVTGAVSVVGAETIAAIKPMQASHALQGTVAGVNVNINGSPGGGSSIRIRGIATNGENRPTVIVDGYVSELDLINPADIETMTVLKDAQAAIYGTIAANGIILITTKSGKRNTKPRVSYNTYTGFQETSRKLPLLNATEYALLLNESYANGGQAIPFPVVSGLGNGTDWQDEVFETAPVTSHDISMTGGGENVGYSVSASHFDQDGIVGGEKSGYLRNTARVGLNTDITSKLKMQTNAIYTYMRRRTLNDFGLGSVLFNALNTPGTLSAYNDNGDFTLVPNTTGLGNEVINPLAQIANTFNRYDYRKINGTFGLEYEVFEGLKANARIGYNTSNSESRSFAKQISYGGKVFDNPRSSVTQSAVNDNNYSFDAFLEYKKTLDDSHNFTLLLGNTIFREWGNGLFATGYDVPGNTWENADLNLTEGTFAGLTNAAYDYDERRLSYFGRLQYDFKGRYLLSAMLRRDSSTKFGPNNRVAWFPSVTAGWVISDEEFFGTPQAFNFLKFRGSYGVLGNDQIPNNGYLSLLSGEATYVFDGVLVNGGATGIIPNPNLQWEEAKKLDVGFDMRFFNNALEVTADYFSEIRDNLLIPGLPVSGTIGTGAPGAAAPTVNAGAVKNYGGEFALTYKGKIAKDFGISASYNVTLLKNKVLEVNNGTGFLEGGNFSVGQPVISRMEVGQPLGYFYGYKTDGLFQNQAEVESHPSQAALGAEAAPGDIRYVDINNDGVINTSDRTNIGDPIPSAIMGFNFTLDYKRFDFSTFTFANVGQDMVRNYERVLSDVNRLDYVLDRWTGEGTSNSVPRVTTGATGNNVFSDYFVEDASFLRIQKVELGYTINPDATMRAGISKVRIYTAVNNLYTFTKYKGYDPAASTGAPIGGGIDFGFYPVPRTMMFGASINF